MLRSVYLVSIGAVVAGLNQPGCSVLRTACERSLPTLTASQSYATDAVQALEQVADYVMAAGLPPEAFAKVRAAIEDTRKALRASQALILAATNACTETDPLKVFASFVDAWKSLREVIALVTPLGTGPGVRMGGLPFDDPEIYKISIAKRQSL